MSFGPGSWYFNPSYRHMIKNALGYTAYKNTQASASAQIGYEEYLKAGNRRALSDWNRNVGSKGQGRYIRYPELSYAGQIARSNTAIARARLDYDTAGANYTGNVVRRVGGLFSGVVGRSSRYL